MKGSPYFPGTEHKFWVYVPEQFQDDQTACLHMAFDGIHCQASQAFDELIIEGKIPITIGIQICDPNGRVRGILRWSKEVKWLVKAMQIDNGQIVITMHKAMVMSGN